MLLVVSCSAVAWARPITPPSLVSVHAAVHATHHWQALAGENPRRYWWVADRHGTAANRRWQIAAVWWSRAADAHTRYVAVAKQRAAAAAAARRAVASSGFPDHCVAVAEESGHNSWAGYFGTISPPGSYGVPGEAAVATYGYSWLNWPYAAQLVVAQQIYAAKGGSAWGVLTRAKCGI